MHKYLAHEKNHYFLHNLYKYLTIVNYIIIDGDHMGTLKVLQPQEVEVYYLLPAIRKHLAVALKSQGNDQRTIAKYLGLTEAAISQYMSGKRGHEAPLPKDFVERITQVAATITDEKTAYASLQQLMQVANETRVLCDIHTRMDKSVPQHCDICFKK